MEKEYRVISGRLKNKKDEEEVEIKFGLVYLKNGVYYLDLYLSNENYRSKYYKDEDLIRYVHTFEGTTEKNYSILCDSLLIVQLSSTKNSKIKFECTNYLEFISEQELEKKNNLRNDKPIIKYIELEGLNLFLADFTENTKYRSGQPVKDFFNFEFDHYRALLICDHLDQLTNNFEVIFFKNVKNENIIVEFKYKENNNLTYESYRKIKRELIYILSFANNGNISVRRELFGNYISQKQDGYIDSSRVRIYSFPKMDMPKHNYYFSIHKKVHGGNRMLKTLLMKCFNLFIEENKKLDFCNTIHNLNNAEAVGLEERYYILITVLERLASNLFYFRSNNSSATVIDLKTFDLIKKDLKSTLEKYKNFIQLEKDYNTLMSRLCSINNINKNETKQKLIDLFQYANIPFTPAIESLVNIERNTAVHEGKFGDTQQVKINNYYKLDHIIKDIILNLINYDDYRGKRIIY